MNSLEDTFVKIGIDDEMQGTSGRESYKDIMQMPKPRSLTREPVYNFKEQFTAMFFRQFYMTTRNWTAMMMIIMPIIFNYIGLYIAKHFLDNLKEYLQKVSNKMDPSQKNPIDVTPMIFPMQMYIFTVFIVQSYSLNTSIYINTPVLERETQLKHALNVMGCRPLPYWLGTLASDYMAYLFTFIIFFYSLVNFDIAFMTPYLYTFLLIMTIFGLAMITFCYLAGFMFSTSNSAFKSFPLIAFFISYNIPFILSIIISAFVPSLDKPAQIIFLLASPFLTLSKALSNMNNGGQKNRISQKDIFDSWEAYVWIMAGQTIGFFLLTMIIEKRRYSMKAQPNQNAVTQNQSELDEGVKREIERVESLTNCDPIKAKHLQKIYKNGFHAVKGTTFGVEKGQIFGLLGPNGAGKSSTFNILTANIPKTSGKAFLKGQELSENPTTYFQDIGVCPQINVLWEYLNPVEHLSVFGRVKGLTGEDLKQTVNYYNAQMQLRNYTCRSANLSGGNKRKLCVANALIASPSLQFFDEPSTGMFIFGQNQFHQLSSTGLDPIAKRYLWRCMRENLLAKNSSIVLTTHSLHEAEDLCGKIGIQVNGQFICLDTLQNLKNQNGDGFKFLIKLIPEINNKVEINQAIIQHFQKAQLINQTDPDSQNYLLYKLPSEDFSFSSAFALLHDNLKMNSLIDDFSISQVTLEEIFIYYSQFQVNNPLIHP